MSKTFLTLYAIDSSDVTNIPARMSSEVRDFISESLTYENRIRLFRRLMELDPDVAGAQDHIALMVANSYKGPAIPETYEPTPKFLERASLVLAEMSFPDRIDVIVREMLTVGDVIYQIHREKTNEIEDLELLETDVITIRSKEWNESDDDVLIDRADEYVMNEEDEEYEEILKPAQVWHVAHNPEGHRVFDSLGRDTRGIWGRSVCETIMFWVKLKMSMAADFGRWFRNGMPRWHYGIDMANVLDLSQYDGSPEEKRKAAKDRATEIFKGLYDQLHYQDMDENSSTYKKWLPLEPEDFVITSNTVTPVQLGGNTLPSQAIERIIMICDRKISSALGVSMALLGYEEGTTYASSYISKSFMISHAGGLLKSIEQSLKEFMRREFEFRGWQSVDEDWAAFFLDYTIDESSELNAELDIELKRAQMTLTLTQLITQLGNMSLINKKQAREILRRGAGALQDIDEEWDDDDDRLTTPGGEGLADLGLMQRHCTSLYEPHILEGVEELQPVGHMEGFGGTKNIEDEPILPREEEDLENAVGEAFETTLRGLVEALAREVRG